MSRHTFFCIDAHTCGNPVRLVAGGGPLLLGNNMSEKRQHFLQDFDWIRRGLMFEPRGHDQMSGAILYPPHDPENDMAVLFIETSGCLPMCGHGTIGTVTIGIEEGLIRPKIPGQLKLETPAGLISVTYLMHGMKVASVKLSNVPSFLVAQDLEVDCENLGTLSLDVGYGGNFYGIIDIQPHFKGLEKHTTADLITWSKDIREQINEKYSFVHPLDSTIQGCTHILWAGKPLNPLSSARNAVFYGDKAIDRSPCGTGTSARMAQWVKKGLLKKGDQFIHESIIGSIFTGTVENLVKVGPYDAIIPTVEGWAKIYGYNTITLDEDDPYVYGFQVK